MKRRLIPALPLVALSLTLAGCDGGASMPQPEPVITGVWRVRSVQTPQSGLQQCPAPTPLFACTGDTRITIHANGSLIDTDGNTRLWTYAENRLRYTGLSDTVAILVTVQPDAGLMEWDVTAPGQTATLLLEKQ